MNFEPVRPPAVSTARLGHANRETFLEPTCLAGCSISLVDDTDVIVLTVGNHCLVVTESSKERLAALASEGSEMEPGCFLITHSAQLVLQRVDVVDLVLGQHVVSRG